MRKKIETKEKRLEFLSVKDAFLATLQNNIATVLSRENDKTLIDIDNHLEELQTEF